MTLFQPHPRDIFNSEKERQFYADELISNFPVCFEIFSLEHDEITVPLLVAALRGRMGLNFP